MVYRWNLEGTALEFPTPYQTENRFLTLRGYALLALALLVLVVLTFVGPVDSSERVISLDAPPPDAAVWPHVLGALWMALLGVINLVRASRQRALLMVPGQPASLMQEVQHEATGASPHAPWLMQAMNRGMASAQAVSGAYASWVRRLSPDIATASSTLLSYLRVRVSHLMLLCGLALVAAAGVAASVLLAQPVAQHLVALVVGLAVAVVYARNILQPTEPALAPWLVALVIGLTLVLAAPLAFFAGSLPGAGKWPRMGFPLGVLLLLGLGFLLELLAIQAARQHIETPRPSRVAAEETTFTFDADLAQLFNEVDRELFRRWAEGIPNRRYARQPPVVDAAAEEGSFSATVLEESQPLVTPADAAAARIPGSGLWLTLLALLGLVLTLTGGLLWLWLAATQMRDSTSSWVPGILGLVCLMTGGYALNLAHMLYSRVVAVSTLTWLEFKGTYFRVAGTTAPAAGRRAAETAAGVDAVTLRACVVQARSVFYAAGRHGIGSRALVTLTGDTPTAESWTGMIQTLARDASTSPAAASPALLAARAKVRERRAAVGDNPGQPKRPARFCSACGTPLLAGARFCQHCGTTVSVDS
ncbi:MAG: zinc ribbon domain-containing protein [Rubrivivax sp.]|nr:zinc ribbon domain-containing protein [Rubrivivax sp.]